MTTFEPFPKIARLNRDCTVSEKIDGTNAAVQIVEAASETPYDFLTDPNLLTIIPAHGTHYAVFAQSRNKFITIKSDNYGFARWVYTHAGNLVVTLGEGTHFGEWWGSGIQRKYGLTGGDKRFSLFNTHRYKFNDPALTAIPGLNAVPILMQGPFDTDAINAEVNYLAKNGSKAAPGFMKPEGVIVYNHAAKAYFKVTTENDEKPKGQN